MPNTLFIRPCQVYQTNEAKYEWALYDLAGVQLKYGAQSTLELIDQTLMQNGIENIEVVGFWPANAAFSSKVHLPGNQSRYIQQALPFAVEDQVAQDIEQIHISLGSKSKSGDYSVLSVDRALFKAFFNSLSEDEILPPPLKSIHLDADLLPVIEHDLVLCIAPQTILLKGSDQRSICLQQENLIPYLDSLFLAPVEGEAEPDDKKTECTIQIYVETEQMDQAKMLIAQIEQYPGAVVSVEQIGFSQFELLCESYFRQSVPAINLCQGDFQITSQSSGVWRRWRSVAVIAGLGILLQLGVFIGQGTYYEQQAAKIGEQALAKYKQIVPNSKRVTLDKLPRIIKGKLNLKNAGVSSNLDFLDLLGEAGYQFKQSKFNSSMKFKSINYNEQRGELVMEMQAESYEQLENLQQSIVSAGLTAKISSAVQEKDYFRGRISVGGA